MLPQPIPVWVVNGVLPSGFARICDMMEGEGALMNRPKCWFLILFLLFFGCARKQPTTAPIFDEKANAHRDIAAAIANAEGSKRNIALVFGANW